jgi:2-hydroxychromene-2-carboxylate isomerase
VRRHLALCALALAACGDGDDPVIARLDGRDIHRSEVSAPAAFRLYRYEAQAYALLEDETQRLVDERLLAEAARREGLEPDALLARIEGAAPAVSEAEVERYLAENAGERTTTAETARARVRQYLEQKARIERRLAFFEAERKRAGFAWLLPKPVLRRVEIDAGASPARGPADAGVTIVHFASFGSRASAHSAQLLARLAVELPGRVRWLHVNFPHDDDAAGRRAAALGFAAQDEGRFWPLHDALYARQGELDAESLAAAAREAGLADGALARAAAPASLERLDADLEIARRAGALREPTLFVNGLYWTGRGGYPALLGLVEQELARAVDGAPSGR